jgi:hypothetical protein
MSTTEFALLMYVKALEKLSILFIVNLLHFPQLSQLISFKFYNSKAQGNDDDDDSTNDSQPSVIQKMNSSKKKNIA